MGLVSFKINAKLQAHMNFSDLNLKDELLEAISYMDFNTATPIQEKVIPSILQNKDVIACAQTGTGKTASFVLPILDKLIDHKDSNIDSLIIVPTRELAIQIEHQIQGFSYFVSASSIAIYGGGEGTEWEQQKNALKKGVNIVVATPGKLLSFLKMGLGDFSHLRHLILDEADRMLDMGFIDDLLAIFSYLPSQRQTLMFSATMPPAIKKLAKEITRKPDEVLLSVSKPAEGIDQKIYMINEAQKIQLLKSILLARKHFDSIIIFTSTKAKVAEIVRELKSIGFPSKGISSNLEQKDREQVLNSFLSRQLRILVATDVVSRGIDVKDINLVLNYDIPRESVDYVHRVGRTARVKSKGEAITFVTPRDKPKLRKIEELIESSITRMALPDHLKASEQNKGIQKKPKGKKAYYKKKKTRK